MKDMVNNKNYTIFDNADTILLKKYIEHLSEYDVVALPDIIKNIEVGSNIELLHIDKIVYDKDENIHDKLMTVYTSFLSNNASLVMMLNGKSDGVDLYLGIVIKDVLEGGKISPKRRENLGKALQGAFEGNFPGSRIKPIDMDLPKEVDDNCKSEDVATILSNCFKDIRAVSTVSGIAELRNREEHDSESFVQGMEKLVDSMRGKKYSVIYLADIMNNSIIEELRSEYEDIYSQLSPYKQSVVSFGENKSITNTESKVIGVTETTNSSITNTVTHGTTCSTSFPDKRPKSLNLAVFSVQSKVNNKQSGTNESNSQAKTTGKAHALTSQNSVANAITYGTSENMQITYENKSIINILDRIDEQLKRLKSCQDFGLFDTCVYFLSSRPEIAAIAAGNYRSIIRGENSSIETSAINVWNKKGEVEEIIKYISRFYHPMFCLKIK